MAEVEEAAGFGITYGEPKIDIGRPGPVERRSRRQADRRLGRTRQAQEDPGHHRRGALRFTHGNRSRRREGPVRTACIIAAGSRPIQLPGLPEDERILDSTGALHLEGPPKSLLVVGGGIIGLEMACVYDALGTEVSVVELTDTLIPECDRDLVKPLQKRIEGRYERVMLGTEVTGMEAQKSGIKVSFSGEGAPESERYDKVLVAVGRRANGDLLDMKAAGVEADDRGVITVDERQRTGVDGIYAIGDITGPPMLAHRSSYQGIVAAENAAGEDVIYDARAVPSVAYTDPEITWAGLTESDAKEQGVEYEIGKVPWAASGRALATGRSEGLTKVLSEPGTGRILGAGMVGPNAGELIAQVVHAIEMGSTATDIALNNASPPDPVGNGQDRGRSRSGNRY